jgi:hypothetical protein
MIEEHAVAQLVEALLFKPEVRWFDSRWCHWKFLLIYSFRPHYGPGVDSACHSTVFPEYVAGGWGGGCKGDCRLHMPTVLICGGLSFLEPSGPFQACNEIALRLLYLFTVIEIKNALYEQCSFYDV